METIYRRIEGKQRWFIIGFLIVYGCGLLSLIAYNVYIGEYKLRLENILGTSFYFLQYFCVYGAITSSDKIRINEELGEISLADPVLGIKVMASTIYIKDITSIEVIKSKKTNRIRRFNIRCGPVKFYQVRVARREEFFNHIKSLVPNIQVIERFGSAI